MLSSSSSCDILLRYAIFLLFVSSSSMIHFHPSFVFMTFLFPFLPPPAFHHLPQALPTRPIASYTLHCLSPSAPHIAFSSSLSHCSYTFLSFSVFSFHPAYLHCNFILLCPVILSLPFPHPCPSITHLIIFSLSPLISLLPPFPPCLCYLGLPCVFLPLIPSLVLSEAQLLPPSSSFFSPHYNYQLLNYLSCTRLAAFCLYFYNRSSILS